jgi:hypothetical protein
MRSDLRVKKKMLRRYFKKEYKEFKLRKKMLRRNMSKRENHSRIWRSKFSRFNLKMRERMLFSWRNMRILKNNRENSLKISNSITKS